MAKHPKKIEAHERTGGPLPDVTKEAHAPELAAEENAASGEVTAAAEAADSAEVPLTGTTTSAITDADDENPALVDAPETPAEDPVLGGGLKAEEPIPEPEPVAPEAPLTPTGIAHQLADHFGATIVGEEEGAVTLRRGGTTVCVGTRDGFEHARNALRNWFG